MEQRRQEGRGDNADLDAGGYMTGPKAMAALSNDDFEELQKLRKENGILKNGLTKPPKKGMIFYISFLQ